MSGTANRTLIYDCAVVDATRSEAIEDAAILVEDGRITDVGARREVLRSSTSDGARHLSLGGRYVSPGLINMHTHLSLTLPGRRGAELKGLTSHQLALYMADGARRSLVSGVTTVRCVGERDHAELAVRSAIDNGYAVGSRIYTAGRPIASTGGHGHGSSAAGAADHGSVECDGAVEFARAVREQIREGSDLIKLMISGGISGEHETIATRQVTTDELSAAISTAHDWGRKVTAHAGPADIIAEAVELGVDCIEHGYVLTKVVTDAMAARGVSLVPTLGVTRCKEFFEEIGVPEWMQQRSLGAGERHLESFSTALSSGVDVLLGSDLPPFWQLEGTTATVRELEHMSQNGLGPVKTLIAATLGPSRWLGADQDLGSVEVGKLADLIVTEGNPQQDTSAYRTISWVMKDGKVFRDEIGSEK